ncbi:hypothetical protein [Pseudoalteromonas sp. R3]|uniref:hypothetical protein n=1 Tax=Pseudoalteromonas sp. R3 TaxID=1709477 RepID=UPI0006B4D17E|nr:hypothetical protein [Pseudoalteromonas sp. R3]AZZ98466.1 hypothetical protein ELR70_15915 [Pseudoalteromonas sp. R3]
MINIDGYDETPMQTGETRKIVITGDGPFEIINSCFVDSPPPPGFKPCSACRSAIIQSGEVYRISTDPKFWLKKEGYISIEVTDSLGNSKSIKILVLSDQNNNYSQMTMGG